MEITQITGQFVLCAPSGDFKFDKNFEIIRNSSGVALLENPDTVYLESDAGEGKANYWTVDIEKAFIFTDIDSAIRKLLETNKSYSPVTIRQVI